MGNHPSSSSNTEDGSLSSLPGRFRLELDHEEQQPSGTPASQAAVSIVAGTNLTGRLMILQEFASTLSLPSTSCLQLQLIGLERTTVWDPDSPKFPFHASRILCSGNVTLLSSTTSNQQEMGGTTNNRTTHHIYPFSLHLPQALPSSMDWIVSGKGSCHIEYRLVLALAPNSRSQGNSRTDALLERPLSVQAASGTDATTDADVPAILAPQAYRVRRHLFGLSRGDITIAARVVDSHVTLGQRDSLKLYLSIQNHATASICQVQVQVLETIQWKSEQAQDGRSVTVLTEISNVHDTMPGIHREKKRKHDQSEHDSCSLEDMHQALYDDQNCITIPIPSCTPSTSGGSAAGNENYSGQLIQVTHMIRIITHTRSNSTNPKAQIPIHINPAAPEPPSTSTASVPDNTSHTTASISTAWTNPNDDASTVVPMAQAIVLNDSDAKKGASPVARSAVPPHGSGPKFHGQQQKTPVVVAVAHPVMGDPEDIPSIAALLQEMTYSIYDYDILTSKLADKTWVMLLKQLTPEEYGSLLARVQVEKDQPMIGKLLADHMNEDNQNTSGGFTCRHLQHGLQNVTEVNRVVLVEEVLLSCCDVLQDQTRIQQELNEWEIVITKGIFLDAIRKRQP